MKNKKLKKILSVMLTGMIFLGSLEGLSREVKAEETDYTPGFEVLGEAGVLEVAEDEGLAFRAFSSEPGQIATLRIGESIRYDAWSTHVFHVDSNGGSHIAYCANPSMQTPPAGQYVIEEIKNDEAKAVMITNPWGPEPWLEFWDTQIHGGKNAQYCYAHSAIGSMLFNDTHGINDEGKRATIFNGISGMMARWISQNKSKLDSYRMFIINRNNAGGRQSIVWIEKADKGSLSLKKSSSNPSISDGNSCYSLNGAVYGVFSDQECQLEAGILITDEKGDSNTISGLAAATYFVKELEAPEGYILDTKVYSIEVKANETAVLKVQDEPGNDPVSVKLNKVDSETKETVQGGASLEGAEFKISYYAGYYDEKNLPEKATRSWVIATKEKMNNFTHQPTFRAFLEPEYLVNGDDFYTNQGIVTLPLGTISIEEIKAPEGYSLNNKYLEVIGGDGAKFTKYVTQITMENNIPLLKGGNEFSVPNQVIRGDLEGVKIAEGSHKRLADVKFKITSKSTGENHVIVTDKNGQFSTRRAAHSRNTNKGESYQDGIWFGAGQVNDNMGALPYDTYLIEELRGESNKDYDLIPPFEVIVNEDKQLVHLGTLTDKPTPPPTLKTTALDKTTNSHVGAVAKKTVIEDTVKYKNVLPGKEYTIKGKLMVKETNQPFTMDGKAVTAEKTFIPEEKDGEVKLSFEIDSTLLEGKTVVAFEDLHKDGKSLAIHADIEDEDQSVHYPKISTSASVDGKKTVKPEGEVKLVDLVEYENLVVGKSYTVKGKLMDKESQKALLINGKEVTAETTFEAKKSSGKVEVVFTFDASSLDKKSVVVFEDAYQEDVLIASHADIKDEGQTVTFEKEPEIKIATRAVNGKDGSKVIKEEKAAIIKDTVSLENLVIGHKYKISGIQMNQKDGKKLIIDGKEVTGETVFVADKEKMEVVVEFTLDSRKLEGRSLVTFEELYDITDEKNPKKVAEHKDIHDEGQTVRVEKTPTKTLSKAKSNPKTGDQSPIFGFALLAFISLASIVGYLLYKKRNCYKHVSLK